MNIQFLMMILGDLLMVIIMGFYAGVGIWESGTLRHILGMLLPAIAVWIITSILTGLYKTLPKETGSVRELRELPAFFDKAINWQNSWKLLIVWAVTCLFACFWQAYYWRHILKSQTYFYRFGIHTVLWYVTSYGVFFVIWRAVWTNFAALFALAKTHRALHICCISVASLLIIYSAAVVIINMMYRPLKYTVDTVPENAPRTALVFGAGVYLNGQPSAVLADRVNTAIDLYARGIIDEMIMSGDNSDSSRNEVDHMIEMAVEAGIPESAVLRDDKGVHTAESCWNAKNVFGKDEVIFISQDFHAVRILMTAESYGLSGISVKADRRIYNVFSWATWYILDWIRLPIYRIHYSAGSGS